MADNETEQAAAPRCITESDNDGPHASAVPLVMDIVPCVGIVWGVRDGCGPLQLVTDCTLLTAAETYGDCLTHPHGHHEVWEGWRRLGPAGLARRGLPPLIAWHEYEHFPRGRVVFDTEVDRFTLYADRNLQAPAILGRILYAFGLDLARCDVRSDPHYRSVRDL